MMNLTINNQTVLLPIHMYWTEFSNFNNELFLLHYDPKPLDVFFTKMVLELINVKTSYISKLLL